MKRELVGEAWAVRSEHEWWMWVGSDAVGSHHRVHRTLFGNKAGALHMLAAIQAVHGYQTARLVRVRFYRRGR